MMSPRLGWCDLQRFSVHSMDVQTGQDVLLLCTRQKPGRVAQSIARLAQKAEVPGSIPDPVTYFRFSSADSRRTFVSYWRKYVLRTSCRPFYACMCTGWLGYSDTNYALITDYTNKQ